MRIPYPIVLVLGGAVIGFIPGAPEVHLNPDLVLVAVLPPLLYGGAFFTSLRELRANMKAIGFLAVGLVLVTMVAVAAVAHAVIPGLDWPESFVLGALVAPTDPTASSAIAERLGLPTRLVCADRGREPRQRRHRARRLPLRRRRRGHRQLLALRRELALRAQCRSAGSASASRSAT